MEAPPGRRFHTVLSMRLSWHTPSTVRVDSRPVLHRTGRQYGAVDCTAVVSPTDRGRASLFVFLEPLLRAFISAASVSALPFFWILALALALALASALRWPSVGPSVAVRVLYECCTVPNDAACCTAPPRSKSFPSHRLSLLSQHPPAPQPPPSPPPPPPPLRKRRSSKPGVRLD